MSGPKTSRYTLTAEQRRILREQQERELKIKTEKASIRRYASELRLLCAEISEPIAKAEELNTRSGYGSEYILSVTKAVQQAQDIIAGNVDVSGISEPDALERQRIAIEKCLQDTKKQSVSFKNEAKKIEQLLKANLTDGIDKGFSLSFEQLESADVVASDSNLTGLMKQIIGRLDLLVDGVLPANLRGEASAAIEKAKSIDTIDFLENFNAVVVIPIEKRCKRYLAEYERNIDEFNSLVVRHQVLCDMLGLVVNDIQFSLGILQTLADEISEMEKRLVQQSEESYIAETIDEVMAEMGYDVLGSRAVTKRDGNRFKSELYSFNDGTAVNVTFASDGRITMELGGLDDKDRTPTTDESKRLCEDMEEFCGSFKEIERRLSAKGIIAGERIAILPPTTEYAQILNASDFDVAMQVSKLDVKRNIRKSKAKKVGRME